MAYQFTSLEKLVHDLCNRDPSTNDAVLEPTWDYLFGNDSVWPDLTTPLNEHAKGKGEGEGEAEDGSGLSLRPPITNRWRLFWAQALYIGKAPIGLLWQH